MSYCKVIFFSDVKAKFEEYKQRTGSEEPLALYLDNATPAPHTAEISFY